MKRICENNVSNNTRSKKPKLTIPNEYKIQYISATHLYNYMVNNTLVDWLKYKKINYVSDYNKKNYFGNFLLQKGVEFENNIINYLKLKHEIVSVSEEINDDTVQKTKDLMFKGVPIIHSAPLRNTYEQLHGVADLLIRSDYINEIFEEEPLSEEETTCNINLLNQSYYYIVVDIKYSTLPLRADATHLSNSQHYLAYKSQCLVYTNLVSSIQGYTSDCAFILGRRNKYTKNGITQTNYNCLNRLGRISFTSIDKEVKDKMKDAIKWIKDLRKNGHKWTINPPSRNELYPNMCVDSGIWNKEKELIAEEIGEITSIWHLGIKHRNIAFAKGIKSWKDKKCTAKNMNINGSRKDTIDKILSINRQTKCKIYPKVIINNLYEWKNVTNEVFVDFETMGDMLDDFSELPYQKSKDMIFMIGVGYKENNQFKYKNFCCDENTRENEFLIMDQFNQFMAERNFPKMFCWYAEPNFWRNAEERQFDIAFEKNDTERKDLISDKWKINNWVDMCKIFQEEPIVIKDCYKFGLKSIAKAMYRHKMIKTTLESNCDNGLTCMVKAWELYKNKEDLNSELMDDIKKYNKFDCKVLWEITEYLRKNHS